MKDILIVSPFPHKVKFLKWPHCLKRLKRGLISVIYNNKFIFIRQDINGIYYMYLSMKHLREEFVELQ